MSRTGLAEQIIIRALGINMFTISLFGSIKNLTEIELTWGLTCGPILFVGIILSEIMVWFINLTDGRGT